MGVSRLVLVLTTGMSLFLTMFAYRVVASCNAPEYRQYDCYERKNMDGKLIYLQYFKTECTSAYDSSSDGSHRKECTPAEKLKHRTPDTASENTNCSPVSSPTIATCTGDDLWNETDDNVQCCYTPDGS
jgi:hypothetical protein